MAARDRQQPRRGHLTAPQGDRRVQSEAHAPVSESPESEAVDADRSRSVKEAIATLPETYGVPLILRYTEDLSYAEIAEVLSISVPAVKSRLFRARNMLAGKTGRGAGVNGPRPCDPEPVFELADGSLGPEREREIRAHGEWRLPDSLRGELRLNASLGSLEFEETDSVCRSVAMALPTRSTKARLLWAVLAVFLLLLPRSP